MYQGPARSSADTTFTLSDEDFMDVVQQKTNPQKVKPVRHRHTCLHGDILFPLNQAVLLSVCILKSAALFGSANQNQMRYKHIICRIIEWFELEGTLKVIYFQPPCHDQGHRPLVQVTSSHIHYLLLNRPKDMMRNSSSETKISQMT